MARPIITRITPFDGTKSYDVNIAWTGNRSYKNRLIIYDNETNAKVYDTTLTTYALTHTIPANTLTNGKSWTVQAQLYDVNDTASVLSEKVLFYTLQTPTFEFSDLPDGKIANSSFTAYINYNSPESERLNSYVFYLYDSTRRQLLQSNTLTDDVNIGYTYRALENMTDYYIRCTGITVNGIPLDTGLQLISVKYQNPNSYARIYATPNPNGGYNQVATNLIIIQYNGTETFEYVDGRINLDDKVLYYDEGFNVEKDFTVIIRGKNFWHNKELLKMSNEAMSISVSSIIGGDGRLRFRLMAPNGLGNYLIYSSPQVFLNEDVLSVMIRRKNNFYNIEVFKEA